jgi:hypothetical protein
MTTTKNDTIKEVLTKADPNQLADAFRKLDLGNLLQAKEWDSGTITAAAIVNLPEDALLVQSARVVTSGTAASVGTYLVADPAAAMIVPPGGASAAVGIARASAAAEGRGISAVTFPNSVTRVVVRYVALAKAGVKPSDKFAPNS